MKEPVNGQPCFYSFESVAAPGWYIATAAQHVNVNLKSANPVSAATSYSFKPVPGLTGTGISLENTAAAKQWGQYIGAIPKWIIKAGCEVFSHQISSIPQTVTSSSSLARRQSVSWTVSTPSMNFEPLNENTSPSTRGLKRVYSGARFGSSVGNVSHFFDFFKDIV